MGMTVAATTVAVITVAAMTAAVATAEAEGAAETVEAAGTDPGSQ